jgi:PHD/YefM family antitoxin component YafN of YafNO toxin-antitoxin module
MQKIHATVEILNKVSVKEARDNFSDILGMVHYGNQSITIEKSGEPFAILINPLLWDEYKEFLREKARKVIDAIHERNKDVDPKKLEQDIDKAIAEVRAAKK